MKATLGKSLAILGALALVGNPAGATTTIPIDQIGNVGLRNAIAIGADGFPIVSYLQGANLRYTKCGSADCIIGNSSATLATGGVEANLSLVVPPDGRPVFAYLQTVGGTLVARVTRCGNPQCSIGNTTETLPGNPLPESDLQQPVPFSPKSNGIALAADGLPIVAFAEAGGVRVVKCNDAACVSRTSTIAALADVFNAKIAVGPDGKAVIAAVNPHLQVAKCADASCSVAPAFREIMREGDYGFEPMEDYSLAVGPDDRPVITVATNGPMRLFRCDTPACDVGVRFTSVTNFGNRTAVTHRIDGLPSIAFSAFDLVNVLSCGDAACTSGSSYTRLDDRGQDVSIAIGSDGHPVVAYLDTANQDLFVARCGDPTCRGGFVNRALAQSGEPLVFVAAFEGAQVIVYESGGAVLTTIPVGDGPIGVAFSRDGTKGYVTNLSSGTVSYIDVRTRTVEKTVALGANAQPRGIAVAPDHGRLYVAQSGTNEVAVIDRAAGTVLTRVPVGQQPFGLAITPDGATVVTASTSGNSATFIATADNAILGTVPVGQQPYGVATSPDGALTYVANFASNSVSVLSTPTRSVVGTIPVGLGPFAIAVRSDGSRLYVSDNQNRVSVVDATTRTVVTSIPVGSHPQGLALWPDDSVLYVANQFSDTVSVVSTNTFEVFYDLPAPGAPVSLGTFVSPPIFDRIQAVEYFHQNFGHYFVTSIPAEIQALDTAAFVGWARTGETFDVIALGSVYSDVCRFFTVAFPPKSSHFYTPLANECTIVKNNPDWTYEGVVFQMFLSGGGVCLPGMTSLYRLYNNGLGGAPNHRYTVKASIRDQMVAAGYTLEGAIGCVPK